MMLETEWCAMARTKCACRVAPDGPFVSRYVVAPIIMLAVPAPHHPVVAGECPLRRAQSVQTKPRGIDAGQLRQPTQVDNVEEGLDGLLALGVLFGKWIKAEFLKQLPGFESI